MAAAVAALDRCDRVKFAKHVPNPKEAEETIRFAREVIQLTAPPPAEEPRVPEAAPSGSAA